MLAAIGFPFAEEFHPIFPEDAAISDFALQLGPRQTYEASSLPLVPTIATDHHLNWVPYRPASWPVG